MRSGLYDQLDVYMGDTWVTIDDMNSSPSNELIQYRFQFKKFLVPIHIQGSQHAFLLEVWPWFLILDVSLNLQIIFHLTFGKIQCLNYSFNRPLTTISSRTMLIFSIRNPLQTIDCPSGFRFPAEAFQRPMCWCQSFCQFSIMANLTSERVQQQLFHNLIPVLLPNRQGVFVPLCNQGTFRKLLYYLYPLAQSSGNYIALGNTAVFSLDDILPERNQVSFICYVTVPRVLTRVPEITTHSFFFRTAANVEYHHSDLGPVEISWRLSEGEGSIVRTFYVPSSLTVGDLFITLENFCGPEYRIQTKPEMLNSLPLNCLPSKFIYRITPEYPQDTNLISSLTDYLQDQLSPLPQTQWFTEHDLIHFQEKIKRQFPRLLSLKPSTPQTILLNPLDRTWFSATILLGTWIPLYYDHIIGTLIIGIPHAWTIRTQDEALLSIKTTYSSITKRLLPSPPEGWCGPLAVCVLQYWLGVAQDNPPIQQLRMVYDEALTITYRTAQNNTAKMRAGGPQKRQASGILKPAPLPHAIMEHAVLRTFYPHTPIPRPYSLSTTDLPYRYLYLCRWQHLNPLLDREHFADYYLKISVQGIPFSPPIRAHSPYQSLLTILHHLLHQRHDRPYPLPRSLLDERQLPLNPDNNLSSYALHLIFQPFFPLNDYHWFPPDFFVSNGHLCVQDNRLWVSLFIADNHWIPVIRVVVQPPVFLVIVPSGANVPLIIEELSTIVGIPRGSYTDRRPHHSFYLSRTMWTRSHFDSITAFSN